MYLMYLFFLFLAAVLATPCIVLSLSVIKLREQQKVIDDSKHITICPKCHQHVCPTNFICPTCGAINKLDPIEDDSLFYHQCRCGTMLPKTVKKGRDRLVAVCPTPKCNNLLGKGIGKMREIIVPIIGGPSTGKSAFMSAWIYYAVNMLRQIPDYNIKEVKFPSADDESTVKRILNQWSRGQRPDKTSEMMPSAFRIDLITSKDQQLRLFCYDPAGECFLKDTNLRNFHYYEYMDSVFFLIDPFSIPKVRKQYAKKLGSISGFQAAESDLNDTCDRFIRSLNKYHHLKNDESHYASCAVVITKADMFDLDDYIGYNAAREFQQEQNKKISFEDAIDQVCYNFLDDFGVGDVYQKLYENMGKIRFFSVSAFGHHPDSGQSYIPTRVEQPFLWVINSVIK